MVRRLGHAFAAASILAVVVLTANLAVAEPAAFPIMLLPTNTRIALRFLAPLDSATARQGDVVELAVAANVVLDHFVLVQKDAHVGGVVVRVTPPGLFGRSAAVVVGYLDAPTTDGSVVPLKDIVISRGTVSTPEEGAVGASLAGAVLLGPVGLVAGAFGRSSFPRGRTRRIGLSRAACLCYRRHPRIPWGRELPAIVWSKECAHNHRATHRTSGA